MKTINGLFVCFWTGVNRYAVIMLVYILSLPVISALAGPSTGTFNVYDYGAAGDGKTKDTQSVQKAIDDCAKTGGVVVLPPGRFLSGTLYLKSHVTLWIQEGAVLLGSTDVNDYPENIPQIRSYTDQYVKQSLIYGENLEQIGIKGNGIIDGQGAAFKVTTKVKPDRYHNRPYVLRLINCRDVSITDVTMRNSAMWMQHYLACEFLTVRGIKVFNHCNQNNDMMDIDGCKNVVISDCIGDTDDDALTLKSTSGYVTENVTVTNCILSSHCNALKCGTESNGGFKNIVVSNILVKPSGDPEAIFGYTKGISGISLEIVDGGHLDGVTISNVRIDGPRTPVFLRLGDRGRIYKPGMEKPPAGSFQNVKISHVLASGADSLGCAITGIPGCRLRNIELSDITINFKGGVRSPERLKSVPENEDFYPESTMFGTLPAYGFFIRHAENVSLKDVDLSFIEPDDRSALIFDDVVDAEITGFKADVTGSSEPMISLINSGNVFLSNSRPKSENDSFLNIKGEGAGPVWLRGNILTKSRMPVSIDQNVSGDVLKCID